MSYTYKRVIFLGVDGAGIFFNSTPTPEMDRILKNGATSYSVMTAIPTISAECWGSMLIGSSAQVHGLTNSIVSAKHYDENSPIPSVFKRIRQAMPDATLASFCNWTPINNGIVEQSIGVTFGSGEDEVLCDRVCEYLDENDPTFLFVHFDSVDGAGHGNGYGTEPYLKQITLVDGLIGKIWDKLAERDLLEDTLFMIIADHGGTPFGSHGGTSDAEKIVFFGAVGKTVKAGTIGEMNVRDSAAIILYALGLPVPEFDFGGFSAQIPDGIFEGYVPSERQDIYTPPTYRGGIPTPSKDGGKFITDFVSPEKITEYFTFDSTTDDVIGGAKVETFDRQKYYGIGYFGNCIEIGRQGYMTLPEKKFGRDSFSLSVWVFIDGAVWSQLPLLGTKPWSGDSTKGFTVVYGSSGFSFNVGDGTSEVKMPIDYPEAVKWGWNNFTVSVDREIGKITMYYNFEKSEEYDIPEEMAGVDFDGGVFTIGQDATGKSNRLIDYKIDDLVIFGDALSTEDVDALRRYYEE